MGWLSRLLGRTRTCECCRVERLLEDGWVTPDGPSRFLCGGCFIGGCFAVHQLGQRPRWRHKVPEGA